MADLGDHAADLGDHDRSILVITIRGVPLALVDDDELELELDEAERARLDAALERSMEQARAGRLIDAEVVVGKLLARR